MFVFRLRRIRTLAGFRRSYNSIADKTISPGGFYHRLTPSLAEYFRDLVEATLDEVAVPNTVDADIERFRDVMIANGTVLRLHEFLSEEYEARKEEQAGARVVSATFETCESEYDLTGGKIDRKHSCSRDIL